MEVDETSYYKSDIDNNVIFIKQFADSVSGFSSQYGGKNSILYSVSNITGKPSNFPHYGDFPQAFTMRTYGPWWDQAPSAVKPFMSQSTKEVVSKDYVDLTFERCVIPTAVVIYETYNPGSVVRIWAYDESDALNCRPSWYLLWDGKPIAGKKSSTKFAPNINPTNVAIRKLRIEFDHVLCDYYPGIDAVLLVGMTSTKALSPLQSGMLKSNIRGISPSVNVRNTFAEFLRDQQGYVKYLDACQERLLEEKRSVTSCSSFESLPPEVVMKVLGYCDLRSLCRLARVNRTLNTLTYDSLLYTELSLRDYWWCYREALEWARPRCSRLKKLDVSWVPDTDPRPMLMFLAKCGSGLTHLRLNSSRFLNRGIAQTVFDVCPSLVELSLQHCAQFVYVHVGSQLVHLQRLNLYHSKVDFMALIALLKQNPGLKHLNLGSCQRSHLLDLLMEVISKYNTNLVSLDLWKMGQMGATGLRSFATLTQLEEIDIGWCVQTLEPANHFETMALSCVRLRKLFLGACRALTDRDLAAFVRHCPLLEQVDLMGNLAVTPDAVELLLSNCRHLKYLDISYCHLITHQLPKWRAMFPHVAIKQSSSVGSALQY